MKFSLPNTGPVTGQASIEIETDAPSAFDFVAEHFFENYPLWATEVVELEKLDKGEVNVGTKGRQVRQDNQSLVESVFEVICFEPDSQFALKGVDAPYMQTYLIEEQSNNNGIQLTLRFDLLEVELFMRPFEKLIRVAIEDGVETAVENIKNLMARGVASPLELQPGV